VTTGPEWGLSFSYDGFGNKTAQTVTKGSGPVMNVAYDANNRVISPAFSYDANGNVTTIPNQGTLTYAVENRVSSLSFGSGVGTVQYLYGRNNERVWAKATGSAHDYEMVYFYGVDGKLRPSTRCPTSGIRVTNISSNSCTRTSTSRAAKWWSGRVFFPRTGWAPKANSSHMARSAMRW
jgi:hypothetical protein